MPPDVTFFQIWSFRVPVVCEPSMRQTCPAGAFSRSKCMQKSSKIHFWASNLRRRRLFQLKVHPKQTKPYFLNIFRHQKHTQLVERSRLSIGWLDMVGFFITYWLVKVWVWGKLTKVRPCPIQLRLCCGVCNMLARFLFMWSNDSFPLESKKWN